MHAVCVVSSLSQFNSVCVGGGHILEGASPKQKLGDSEAAMCRLLLSAGESVKHLRQMFTRLFTRLMISDPS
jgi:hypothetical protein